MVGRRAHTLGLKLAGHLIHPLAAQRVDNARLSSTRLQESQQLIKRLVLLQHRVTDIGPVKPGDMTAGLTKCEHTDNVPARLRIGRGRQRNQGYGREQLPQRTQLLVFRSKVMPPLRHTVRLVDGKQGDIDIRQAGHEVRTHQALGTHVQQVQRMFMQLRQHPARLG